VPEAFFVRSPVEAQVVLSGIRDASDELGRLLDGGHSAIAGRLAGAFRRIGRPHLSDDILRSMKAAGYDVRESDPFTPQQGFGAFRRTHHEQYSHGNRGHCIGSGTYSDRQPQLESFTRRPLNAQDQWPAHRRKKKGESGFTGLLQLDFWRCLNIQLGHIFFGQPIGSPDEQIPHETDRKSDRGRDDESYGHLRTLVASLRRQAERIKKPRGIRVR